MFKTKKEIYNSSLYDKRTYVNGETAIKPYYYLRNGYIHVRYTVDRCMRLSEAEVTDLKNKMSADPANKQGALEKAWSFFSNAVGKDVIMDGIAELEKHIKESKDNGYQN